MKIKQFCKICDILLRTRDSGYEEFKDGFYCYDCGKVISQIRRLKFNEKQQK